MPKARIRPKLCRQHASVNPGVCPACTLAEYYERQLALKDEKIAMLVGTNIQLQGQIEGRCA